MTQNNKYTWLLFDADGTLYDFAKAEKSALTDTFEQLGFSYKDVYLKEYKTINTKIWQDFEQGKITPEEIKTKRFELLLKKIDLSHDSATFGKTYLDNLGNGIFLIEGAEKLIKDLSVTHKIGLITNGLQKVQRSRLAKSILGDYFEPVIISEEVGTAKPDPEIFKVAFDKMDNPKKSEVLIIGDSLTSDIKGGNNFNIDTCWFNPEGNIAGAEYGINYEIHSLDELYDVVGA